MKAKDPIDRLFYDQRVLERDEARTNLTESEKDLVYFAKLCRQHYGDLLLARQERDSLRAELEKYAVAIMTAISCEDGLDGLAGTRLLQETEAGQALLDRAAEMPVT